MDFFSFQVMVHHPAALWPKCHQLQPAWLGM